MTDRAGPGSSLDRILAMLDPVFAADTLEAVSVAAVRGIAVETEALAAGLFIVLHGKVFLEYWYPEDAGHHRELRTQFHGLAVHASEPDVEATLVPSNGGGGRLEVIRLPMKQRLTGVLCLSYGIASPRGERERLNERLAALVAHRLQAIQDIDVERKKSGQYEHWFRVTDKQIRALDRERQKLVVLANHFDACIFVTDGSGTVRWTNRVLLDRIPGPNPGGTWIGRPCRELCATASHGNGIACDGCLLEQIRQAVRPGAAACAARPVPHGAGAYAIRDLQGRAEEIIVVLPESAVMPSRAAA